MSREEFVMEGRRVDVLELHMEDVYSGIIEGVPNADYNARLIANLRERGAEILQIPAVVLQPEVEHHEVQPGSSYKGESIPRVACIARFRSFDPARNLDMDTSELVVIWFQEEFVFPPPLSVFERLQGVEWSASARDFQY